jgi:hypothetical protein
MSSNCVLGKSSIISSKFIPFEYCLNMYCINLRHGFANFSSNTPTSKLSSRLLMKQFSNTLILIVDYIII